VKPSDWSFEPLFLALAAVAAMAYARAAARERPGALRVAAFAAGLLLVAASLNSPFETLAAHYLLLAHLAQNALIADWAPALLILGLTPSMRSALRRRGGRAFEFVTQPTLALPIWLVAWYAVHFAPFYEWALREGWPLNLEHAILIAAGFVFWWPLLEPEPRRLNTSLALVYLIVGFVASPWLALAYIFSTSPFYDFYTHAPRVWGLSPTKDQNLGGILMQSEMTLLFFVLIAHFFFKLLSEEEEKQRELDARDSALRFPDANQAGGSAGEHRTPRTGRP
jgi:cytochrome c oxidase assembly factor CtaG